MHYVGDANFAGVRYGMAAGEHGAWAAGIQYFGYGDMKAADVTGNITGTFWPKGIWHFPLHTAMILPGSLRGGITVKGLYSAYESYSAFCACHRSRYQYYDPDRVFRCRL